MKLAPESNDRVRAAAQWRLISLMLRRPTPAVGAEIVRLADEVPDAELRAAAMSAANGDAAAYLAVLGPGSSISPRLVAYRGMEDPGWILADVMRTYDAFAFRPAVEDPPDHVSVAADFVAYLYLKEAFATARSQDEAAEVTRAARERFMSEHLAPAAAPLSASLAAAGFEELAGAARALAERLPPPPALRVDADPLHAASAACSACTSR